MTHIDYAKELNPEQLDVVLHADGPCLVLAGAGSGKTRTITYRVAHLIASGIPLDRILLLTFTNKAAKEMMRRVTNILASLCPDIHRGWWGGTFHAIANRTLRNSLATLELSHAGDGGRSAVPTLEYTPRFTILDEEDSQSLLKTAMQELGIDSKSRRFPTAAMVRSIVSFARNTQQPIRDALEIKHPHFLDLSSDIEEVIRIYDQRKREIDAMDFDDLLLGWLALLKDERFRAQLSDQFLYILVDEYQDTNALQDAIVFTLGQGHKNVLVVGDDAQSIYAFRGANIQHILRFPEQWPHAKVYKLLTNYRSVPEILSLANDSLAHNSAQFEKELVGVRPHGKRPTVICATSVRQEAHCVADSIVSLRAGGALLSSLAVLFRSASHSQALEFELLRRGLPYDYRGGMKFFERAHIKDALAYLRICENRADEVAWLRALRLHEGIGAVNAAQILRAIKPYTSTHDVLAASIHTLVSSRVLLGWHEFTGILTALVNSPAQPSLMLQTILRSGYREYLEREYPDGRDRVGDLEELVLLAEGYKDVSSFLTDIALSDDLLARRDPKGSAAEDRLVLSTIHQAKGLEWDTVFLIHVAENAFPNRYALAEEGGVEEERRLFYVAVTRARERLFLTYPCTSGEGGFFLNRPSLFVEELSSQVIDHVSQAGNKMTSRYSDTEEQVDSFGLGNTYEEPTIHIDRAGNRTSPATTSVWKQSPPAPRHVARPRSFLRDV